MSLITIQMGDILLMTVVGILVVFIALAILVFAFIGFGKLSNKSFSLKRKKTVTDTETVATEKKIISGPEVAAIAMALHLFLSDEHDEESNVITIKRIERRYSPWNSKIYGMRNLIR
ncbi:MAG: OadG family protein [Paludibacter sp.]|jgi:Na+-transporting methylmalonyl-CoA/oxaloacetate decarboxylase gamma subunit|nr:OadG family protein [Bacteroidales bacterium]HOS45086.1 OadG family protein [Paludibacter sp.]